MNRVKRSRALLMGTLAALAAGAVGVGVYREFFALPKRFAAVEEGRLYRSGRLEPGDLERLQREFGIRVVLSLNNPESPESIAERQEAESLGMRWLNVPLPGNGASTPADRERIRQILLDAHEGPLLVHCSAGVNRTGLAVGMYRLYRQGWTLEQVMKEMRRFDFEDEPHHENLRQALASEARCAATQRAGP